MQGGLIYRTGESSPVHESGTSFLETSAEHPPHQRYPTLRFRRKRLTAKGVFIQ